MRAGFVLLEDAGTFNEVAERGSAADLKEAQSLWRVAVAAPERKGLRHARNKFGAHLSTPDPAIPAPIIRELFTVARRTCAVADRLAVGAGIGDIPVAEHAKVYLESGQAFWKACVRGL